jgi:hypothetical protein
MREVGVAAGWGFMYKYTMGGSANVDDVLGKTTCQANVRGGGIDLFIESTERWAGVGHSNTGTLLLRLSTVRTVRTRHTVSMGYFAAGQTVRPSPQSGCHTLFHVLNGRMGRRCLPACALQQAVQCDGSA